MSIHELLLERNDGRLGPNLIKLSADLDCRAARIQAAKNPSTKPVPGTMPAMMVRGCGSMTAFAGDFYPVARTIVIDKTGLSGEWFLSLRFAADPLDDRLRGPQLPLAPDLPSFSVALKEQAGLMLRPTRGPVHVLVIESVQQSTPD